MAFVFPAHLWCPETVRARIERATLSGGTNLVGGEDTIITDGGGRWEISYGGISLEGEFNNFWEAWNGHLAAGTQDVLVPLLSLETAPLPRIGRRVMQPSDLAYDDLVFPTFVRFAAPYIEAYAVGTAPLRATSLNINMVRGAALKGGEKFSVGFRAYRIGRRLTGNTWSIEPPLREPIAAGASLNFDWPVVRCRSVPGEDFSPDLQFGRFSEAEIRFVEQV